jgi:hypothetical protein
MLDTTNRKQVSNTNLVVAGAGADGHGVLCGYRGEGAMQRSTLADLARRAGLPEQWLPAPKEARVQLQRAVAGVASAQGLSAERDVKRDRNVAWVSRWMLVSANTNDDPTVGAPFGSIMLVVTLADDGTLAFETGDTDVLSTMVRAEYERRVGAELYQASDVTRWLHEIHRERLGGVRYGAGWYVPRAKRSVAEAITQVFWGEARWGEAWMDPPLPVASSEQLSIGIANGLIAEVGEVIAELENQRVRRREANGPAADIGPSAAEGFLVRFRYVGKRVDAYAELLGPDRVTECLDTIADAMIALDSVIEGGVIDALGRWRDPEAERVAAARDERSFAEVA